MTIKIKLGDIDQDVIDGWRQVRREPLPIPVMRKVGDIWRELARTAEQTSEDAKILQETRQDDLQAAVRELMAQEVDLACEPIPEADLAGIRVSAACSFLVA